MTATTADVSLRVALVSPSCDRRACGIGDYTSLLATSLDELGISVTILHEPADGLLSTRLGPTGVRCVPIPRIGTRKGLEQVNSWLAANTPSIVHIQYQHLLYESLPWIYLLPGRARRLPGTDKVAVTVHDSLEPFFFRGAGLLRGRLMRRLLSRPTDVIVSTLELRDYCQRRSPNSDRVFVVPIGPSIPSTASADARFEVEIDRQRAGRHLAVCFGQLAPNRGQHLLVEAIAAMSAELRQRLLVWIVGADAPYADQTGRDYRAQVATRLHDLGLVGTVCVDDYRPPEQVSALLRQCDFVVAPRLGGYSPTSTVALSAIAHRKPMLTLLGAASTQHPLPPRAAAMVQPTTGALARGLERAVQQDLWPVGWQEEVSALAEEISWRRIATAHAAIYASNTALPLDANSPIESGVNGC